VEEALGKYQYAALETLDFEGFVEVTGVNGHLWRPPGFDLSSLRRFSMASTPSRFSAGTVIKLGIFSGTALPRLRRTKRGKLSGGNTIHPLE
jgi:hypothetical protein